MTTMHVNKTASRCETPAAGEEVHSNTESTPSMATDTQTWDRRRNIILFLLCVLQVAVLVSGVVVGIGFNVAGFRGQIPVTRGHELSTLSIITAIAASTVMESVIRLILFFLPSRKES